MFDDMFSHFDTININIIIIIIIVVVIISLVKEYTNVTHRQTDGQTDGHSDGIGRDD